MSSFRVYADSENRSTATLKRRGAPPGLELEGENRAPQHLLKGGSQQQQPQKMALRQQRQHLGEIDGNQTGVTFGAKAYSVNPQREDSHTYAPGPSTQRSHNQLSSYDSGMHSVHEKSTGSLSFRSYLSDAPSSTTSQSQHVDSALKRTRQPLGTLHTGVYIHPHGVAPPHSALDDSNMSIASTINDSNMSIDDIAASIARSSAASVIGSCDNLSMHVQDREEEEENMSTSFYTAQTNYDTARRAVRAEQDAVVMQCRAYVDDIFAHNVQLTHLLTPQPYMAGQLEVNHEMRAILIDWLVDVCNEYTMDSETLHLAVNYIDRFLSQRSVYKRHLQLVGTAAIMIAAKLEQIYPPLLSDFVYITDDTYNTVQVKSMERKLLVELDYRMQVPTSHTFLHLYCNSCTPRIDARTRAMADYMLELVLVEGDAYMGIHAYILAAAALSYANMMCTTNEPWPICLATRFGIRTSEIFGVVQQMCASHKGAAIRPSAKASYEKYSMDALGAVSTMPALLDVTERSDASRHSSFASIA